jgi:hypothetical protein
MTTTALIPSASIEAILAERDAKVQAAERILAIVAATPGFPRLLCEQGRGRSELDPKDIARVADRDGWQRLIEETGLWSFMDQKARAEWEEHWGKLTFPPLTAENAEATIATLHADRGNMVARGVAECFRRLQGYKTNRADRFGERMVLTRVVSEWGNDYGADTLDDLNRVLHVLRGLPEPDHRRGAAMVLTEARHAAGSRQYVAAFPFFTVRVFKNGNGHVYLQHAADVQRLNKVLSLATGGSVVAGGTARHRRG